MWRIYRGSGGDQSRYGESVREENEHPLLCTLEKA